MKDKALYTFHHGTQYNDRVIGIVADNIIEACKIGDKFHLHPLECVNYTLVQDQVEDGIHFNVVIDNPDYEG